MYSFHSNKATNWKIAQSSHKYCQWCFVIRNFALQHGATVPLWRTKVSLPKNCSLIAGCSDTHSEVGWTEFHVCVTVVGLLEVGHSTAKIHTLLRPLKMNERRVYCVKKSSKRRAIFVIICKQVNFISFTQKMWRMGYMLE